MHEWSLFFFTLTLHLSVGGVLALALVDSLGSQPIKLPEILVFCLIAIAGTIFSLTHLGDITGAYRALYNPFSSWLSREAWITGAFTGLTVLCTVQLWRGASPKLLLLAATACGLLAVFASSAVYASTAMEKWNMASPYMEFYGATFLLGPATVAIIRLNNFDDLRLLLILFACGVVLLITNAGVFENTLTRSLLNLRFLLTAAGIVSGMYVLAFVQNRTVASLSLVCLVLGEGLGRYIFFIE